MENCTGTPVNLNTDNDIIDVRWFDTQEQVFGQLKLMMGTGWRVSAMGLTSDGERGPVVARPIKIKGQRRYTGIGVWKISTLDADNN